MGEKRLSETNSNCINVIRIVAALLVLLGHGIGFFGLEEGKSKIYPLSVQNAGVVWLFLLAGFLAAYSLERKSEEAEYSFGKYVRERLARIWPGLIISLVFILIMDLIFLGINPSVYEYRDTFSPIHFIADLLFLENIPGLGDYLQTFGSGRPLWTLSVEWWIYMSFGLVFLKLRKKERFKIGDLVILALCGITSVSNLNTNSRGGGLTIVFLLGVLAYYLHKLIPRKIAGIVVVLSAGLLIVYGVFTSNAYTIWYDVLGFLFLTSLMSLGQEQKGDRIKWLSFAASATYMLYLIHYTVLYFVNSFPIFQSNAANLLISVVVSVVLAGFFYRFLETPLLTVVKRILLGKYNNG